MPRLKPTKQKLIGDRIVKNIRTIGNKHGCRYDKDIAKRSCIPPPTFYKKMREPDLLRLDDFIHISESFGVPLAQIFEE